METRRDEDKKEKKCVYVNYIPRILWLYKNIKYGWKYKRMSAKVKNKQNRIKNMCPLYNNEWEDENIRKMRSDKSICAKI